jgi:hypothetical protein
MVMLTIIVALLAGTLSGAVAGGCISWWLFQLYPNHEAIDPQVIDPSIDHQIKQAASRWAEAHNRPHAAPLAARKLRLAYALQRRRQRKGRL